MRLSCPLLTSDLNPLKYLLLTVQRQCICILGRRNVGNKPRCCNPLRYQLWRKWCNLHRSTFTLNTLTALTCIFVSDIFYYLYLCRSYVELLRDLRTNPAQLLAAPTYLL